MKKGRWMEILVAICILGLAYAGFNHLTDTAKDVASPDLFVKRADFEIYSKNVSKDILSIRTDMQTIFDEHEKKLEILELTKSKDAPPPQRIILRHFFPKAIPVEIIRQTLPSPPMNLSKKANLSKSQMKGL